MSDHADRPDNSLFEPLTRREKDVLALLGEGLTGPEIADKLVLATSSVKYHIQHIYGKLGVNSKRQALARARELGLLGARRPAAEQPQTAVAQSIPLPNPAADQIIRPEPLLPTGTITFLFTDIEGSTLFWQRHRAAMPGVLARHRAILENAVKAHNGHVFQIVGDGFCAAFATPAEGVQAALAAQRALRDHSWGAIGRLRVRMALHCGSAPVQPGDYVAGEYQSGITLSHVSRLLSAAHGGQMLLSRAAHDLLIEQLPAGIELRDLGEYHLKDLLHPEHIYQVVAPGLAADFSPLHSLDVTPNNLPAQLTSFIGREHEMAQVKHLLASARLMTLTGAGGAGKTRLSLQVAADVTKDFPDGVCFVELAPLMDPELISLTVASALGLREDRARSLLGILSDYLVDKTVLIILDNCEHLIVGCAQVAHAILRAAPSVKLLTTSREPLNILGEVTYRVPSLAVPDIHHVATLEALRKYDAAKLFIERASATKPGFEISNANAPAVAQICHHLDGIPLALELAAARVRGMKVEQIASRLDNRFRLLTGGGQTVLPRHQTLRAMIDWSYALLASEERILFRRVAVFTGGWSIEAAEAVCVSEGARNGADSKARIESSMVLDLLLQLVDKSVIVMDEQSPETRYRMLETIHEYALARLQEAGEENDLRARHLEFYLGLAEQAEPQLEGAENTTWLNRLTAEYDNFRGALAWSLRGGNAETGLRLAAALVRFWAYRDLWSDGLAWLERVLAANEQIVSPTRARAIAGLARMEMYHGSIVAARAHAEECLTLFQQLGDQRSIAFALMRLGQIAVLQARYMVAETFFEDGQVILRAIDYKPGLFSASNGLGEIARAKGDYDAAAGSYRAALALAQELGNESHIRMVLCNLGYVAENLGDYAQAEAYFLESLALAEKVSSRYGIALNLIGLAGVAGRSGQPHRAARLFGAGEALLDSDRAYLTGVDQMDYERDLEAARAPLAPEQFEMARSEGRAMTMEQALELARQSGAAS